MIGRRRYIRQERKEKKEKRIIGTKRKTSRMAPGVRVGKSAIFWIQPATSIHDIQDAPNKDPKFRSSLSVSVRPKQAGGDAAVDLRRKKQGPVGKLMIHAYADACQHGWRDIATSCLSESNPANKSPPRRVP